MSQRPIDKLCDALQDEFDRDPRGGKGITTLLRAYQAERRDWEEWSLWSDERYTRNLVACRESFELLILCWKPGQQSPIHDHAGQNCWMSVLEGQLEEIHYSEPKSSATAGQVRLEKGRAKSLAAGGVAFIEDSIAYHLTQPSGGARFLQQLLLRQRQVHLAIRCLRSS
ncbi:MAG: cysteine dioxygenase family protein [Planctomycetota bacterium]|nr:cysteine dioxygenase family protein [Planctomycetota bacterium]